jgi:hypothetical protein
MRSKHRAAFVQFNTTFLETNVQQWEKMVDDWDADPTKPNPYEEPVASTI